MIDRAKRTDILFALMLIGSVIMLVGEGYRGVEAVAQPAQPVMFAIAALASFVGLTVLTTVIASLDRRRSDEYMFRVMGNAAIVAIPTTLMFHMLFGQSFLLGAHFGRIAADGLYAVLIGSWAIGYFTYRVRGTAE